MWGFVNLITGEETVPRWPENQKLDPYKHIWASEIVANWSDMFSPGSSSRQLEWKKTMTIFLAESD